MPVERKELDRGFTLVEIMIVVAIIALLASIAIPSFMTSRTNARATACINNLRLIDSAKQQYATVSLTCANSTVLFISDIYMYIKGATPTNGPICREGGTYTVGAVTSNPTCSFGKAHVLAQGG